MVRFFWKKANPLAGTKETRTKILKAVSFPQTFDIYEFCTLKLKNELQPARDKIFQQRDIIADSDNETEKNNEW